MEPAESISRFLVLWKTVVEGYACLYKAYGETVDFIKEDDVTITFIREAKPTGLFRYFSRRGYQVSNPYPGICYITGRVLFPAQIIVTKRQDIQVMVAVLRKLGHDELVIKNSIKEQYSLSEEEALHCL